MKGREPAKFWNHGKNLYGLRPPVAHPEPPAGLLEWRAVWPEGREAEEVMPPSLAKVLTEDGKRAGPVRSKGMALAPARTAGFQGQKPTPPCPEPPRR